MAYAWIAHRKEPVSLSNTRQTSRALVPFSPLATVTRLAADVERYVLVLNHVPESTSGTRQQPQVQVPDATDDEDASGQEGEHRRRDVLYLAAHGEEEEHEEVDDEDRPIDGHVEHLEEGREDRDYRCARR